MYMKN